MKEETKITVRALGWMYLGLLVWIVTVISSSILNSVHDPWAIPNVICGFLLSGSCAFKGGKLLRNLGKK